MTETATPPTDGAIVIPEAQAALPHATRDELDAAVAILQAHKDQWAGLGIADRISLVDQVMQSTIDVSERWAAEAMLHKGIAPGSAYDGEDMSWGPMILLRTLRLFRKTLKDLHKHGQVKLPKQPYLRDNGQVAVPVFPPTAIDRALFPMTTAEIWLEPDVTLATMQTARIYTEGAPGQVCFVLGAGNVTSIGAVDVIQKLLVENQVCLLKMNPANEWVGPMIKAALAPLIREGYVRVVYGGVDVGGYLTTHPDIETLHMTGSDKTHDAIVYGVGEEGAKRKLADEPINDRPFSTELGNVSPVIVVPGPWTDEDLQYQGKQIHAMINANGGFNCGSMRVLVTHDAWDQRGALLDQVKKCMREAPDRKAFYPGARARWEAFTQAYPQAITYGDERDGNAPITMIPDLDPTDTDQMAFRVESFNGVFGEAGFPGQSLVDYLAGVAEFCNKHLWGTLAATILVHPRTLKDPVAAAAVERLIAELEYGTVCVNAWAGIGYGLTTTTWQAFPGHPRNNICSGDGWVHGTFMIEKPQKSVIRAPWKLGKKPPGAYDFTTMPSLARRLILVEGKGDVKQFPGIVMDGLKA